MNNIVDWLYLADIFIGVTEYYPMSFLDWRCFIIFRPINLLNLNNQYQLLRSYRLTRRLSSLTSSSLFCYFWSMQNHSRLHDKESLLEYWGIFHLPHWKFMSIHAKLEANWKQRLDSAGDWENTITIVPWECCDRDLLAREFRSWRFEKPAAK